MLARVNVSMGDVDSLKATLSEAAVRFAANSDLHGALAQFLLRNKLFDLALAALRRAIELWPMDPGPYYHLARLYEKLGQKEMAKNTFARMRYLKRHAAQ
jgi:Flp pilus assembly protein TadD